MALHAYIDDAGRELMYESTVVVSIADPAANAVRFSMRNNCLQGLELLEAVGTQISLVSMGCRSEMANKSTSLIEDLALQGFTG